MFFYYIVIVAIIVILYSMIISTMSGIKKNREQLKKFIYEKNNVKSGIHAYRKDEK